MLNRPRRERRACSERAGFTLIETALSLLILIFGLLTLAQLFAVAVSNYTMGRSQSFATTAAQRRMEILAGQYQSGATLVSGQETVSVDNPNDANNPFSLYNVSWTISNGARGSVIVQVTAAPVQPSNGPAMQSGLKGNLNKVVLLRSVLAPVKH